MDASPCLNDLDKDFEYKTSNDSHSWLTNYPDQLKPDPNALKISSKNETYTGHEIRREKTKGKRRMMMEAFYRKIISEEMLKEIEEEGITVEEYMTVYMEKFKNPDDMPVPGEKLSKNEKRKLANPSGEDQTQKPKSKEPSLEELKTKYPLYFSTPLTFFSQTTGKTHFRKNSTITKSPDQNYDNIEY